MQENYVNKRGYIWNTIVDLQEMINGFDTEQAQSLFENYFESDGSLEGLKCHEVAFYFLMNPRGTKELNSNSYTYGVKEEMHWIPIEELGNYKAFPTFFRDKLQNMGNGIEHIVTHENNTGDK